MMTQNRKTKLAELAEITAELDQSFIDYAKMQSVILSELQILYSLYTHEKCTQKQICDEWSLPKQTVNTICKTLMQKELIQFIHHTGDKREKWLSLTTAGEKYAMPIILPLLNIEYATEQQFGIARLQTLIDEFRQLEQVFKTQIHLSVQQ